MSSLPRPRAGLIPQGFSGENGDDPTGMPPVSRDETSVQKGMPADTASPVAVAVGCIDCSPGRLCVYFRFPRVRIVSSREYRMAVPTAMDMNPTANTQVSGLVVSKS